MRLVQLWLFDINALLSYHSAKSGDCLTEVSVFFFFFIYQFFMHPDIM